MNSNQLEDGKRVRINRSNGFVGYGTVVGDGINARVRVDEINIQTEASANTMSIAVGDTLIFNAGILEPA